MCSSRILTTNSSVCVGLRVLYWDSCQVRPAAMICFLFDVTQSSVFIFWFFFLFFVCSVPALDIMLS